MDAEAWGDALFKRLWLSGVKADFYNVDWRSNIGGAADYHANASNAFVVAGQIASTIQDIPGEKVLMAHSLGNMVVSSMIQDHHLRVSRYLMCNSAVPAEASIPPSHGAKQPLISQSTPSDRNEPTGPNTSANISSMIPTNSGSAVHFPVTIRSMRSVMSGLALPL